MVKRVLCVIGITLMCLLGVAQAAAMTYAICWVLFR